MVKKVHRGRVAVFTSGVDIAQTETKGTVLLHNAEEMINFTTGEEKHLEKVGMVSRFMGTPDLPLLSDSSRNCGRQRQSHHSWCPGWRTGNALS